MAAAAMTALVEVSRQVGSLTLVFNLATHQKRPLPETIGSIQGRVAAETFRHLSKSLNLGSKA
jgi:hypothetical protein